MSKGISIIVRTEKEYNRIQEFLGDKILYIDWQPLMAENLTGIVIYSEHTNYSVGSVGDAEYQKFEGLRTVEFNDYFKLP